MRKFVKQNNKKRQNKIVRKQELCSSLCNAKYVRRKTIKQRRTNEQEKTTQELKAKSSIQQFEWCCMLSVRRDICRNERQWAINQARVTYSMVKGGTRTEMDPRDVCVYCLKICIEHEKVLFQ